MGIVTVDYKIYYVVQVLRHWNSLEVNAFRGVALSNPHPGCIGFLPVFDTEEAAKKWRDEESPSSGIALIQATK